MKTLMTRALVLGGGVAAVGVLTATAAFAHGAPFAVTAGSAASGTVVAVTGNTIADPAAPTAPHVTFLDTTTNTKLTCDTAKLTGSITTGSSSGSPIATVNGNTAVFTNCLGPAGLKFAVTGSGTWNINISDSTSGVSTGTITNIRAHVVSTAGPTCSFDVGADTGAFTSASTATVDPGTVAGNYTNSSQNLAAPGSSPGTLGLWNTHGSGTTTYCVSPSIIKQTDKASFKATFKLTADVAANNPIAVN